MKISKKTYIIGLLFFIITGSFAQKEGFFYENKIKPGTSVFVMTNQKVIQNDSATFSWGDLVETEQPALYKATFWSEDSIAYEKVDSLTLMQMMSERPGNWLMFVHGAGKTFQRAVWRAFDIAYYYNMNVVAYSWPSADPRDLSFKGFKHQLMKYQQSLPHFKKSFEFIRAFKEHSMKANESLNLLLHSMGNMLLEDLVNNGELNDMPHDLFDNVILNAASVKQENHKAWVEKLKIQKRIYITMNRGDVNLKGVRVFLRQGIQLGQKLKSPPADNAIYINFTKAVGFKLPPGKSHTYFMAETADNHPEIKAFYNNIFNGKAADLSNTHRFKARKDGVGYDFLKQKK